MKGKRNVHGPSFSHPAQSKEREERGKKERYPLTADGPSEEGRVHMAVHIRLCPEKKEGIAGDSTYDEEREESSSTDFS